MLKLILSFCSQPFGYFHVAVVVVASVLLPVLASPVFIEDPTVLHAEGGVLEVLSLLCWIVAALVSIVMLIRGGIRTDFALFTWLALVCALAAAREMDTHRSCLIPKYFGSFGVHYRIDWFLSPNVNISLRLVWGIIFLAAGFVIVGFLFIRRKEILRLTVAGDNAVGLFLMGALFLIGGYAVDDLLRGEGRLHLI